MLTIQETHDLVANKFPLREYLSPNLDLNEIVSRCQASRFDNRAQQVIADELGLYCRSTGLLSSLDTYVVVTSLFVCIVV